MEERLESSLKHRTFARCLIRDQNGARYYTRDVHVGSRDPENASLPEGTESFKFFERIQGYVEVRGRLVFVKSEDLDLSRGEYYPNATQHSYAEYAGLFPDLYLISPKGAEAEPIMVKTQGGNWEKLGPDDVVVRRK